MSEAKRFLVFAGDVYYPYCGIDDLLTTTDTIDEAMNTLVNTKRWDWFQIIDLHTGEMIVSDNLKEISGRRVEFEHGGWHHNPEGTLLT